MFLGWKGNSPAPIQGKHVYAKIGSAQSTSLTSVTTTILTSKVTPPTRRKNLVSRPGLLDQLNQGLSRKLVLISAPAGFGKTTLLADWPRLLAGPVSWYSLDQSDNDLVRFLTCLVSLQLIGAESGKDGNQDG